MLRCVIRRIPARINGGARGPQGISNPYLDAPILLCYTGCGIFTRRRGLLLWANRPGRAAASSAFARASSPMLTAARRRWRRRCSTARARCGGWGVSTTGTLFSTPTRRNARAASRSLPSRRCWRCPPRPGRAGRRRCSRCWTRPGMSIFPPKPSARCRCLTMRSLSFRAPTACRPTPRRCGGCWSATACRRLCSSTRWTCPGRTAPCACASCAPALATAVWTLAPMCPPPPAPRRWPWPANR